MQPHVKLWVEKDGKIVLSDWRTRFLEAIEETGSISAAAEKLHIPYRRMWAKLREMEENLGIKMVQGQSGGPHGGGSRLTPEAREYLQRYRAFRLGINELIQQKFDEAFRGNAPQ